MSAGGRRQTNANQSQSAAKGRNLCRTKLAPLRESGGAVEFEIISTVKAALLVEMVKDGGVNGDEFLQTSHLPEAKHGTDQPHLSGPV